MRRTGHVHGTIVCLMDVVSVAAQLLCVQLRLFCGFVSMSCRVFCVNLAADHLGLALAISVGIFAALSGD